VTGLERAWDWAAVEKGENLWGLDSGDGRV
jgi:hypothetical protein